MIHDEVSKVIEKIFSKERLIQDLFEYFEWALIDEKIRLKKKDSNTYELKVENAFNDEESLILDVNTTTEFQTSYLKFYKSFDETVMPSFVCGLTTKDIELKERSIICSFDLFYNENEEI